MSSGPPSSEAQCLHGERNSARSSQVISVQNLAMRERENNSVVSKDFMDEDNGATLNFSSKWEAHCSEQL